MDDYIIWLIVMIICLVIEAITLGLTTIWFAAGAFIAMLLSFIGLSIGIQIASFLIISVASIIFIYPTIKNKLRYGTEKTNYETLINKVGIVIEEINNMENTGQVKINGQIWSAKEMNNNIIEKNKEVLVKEIKGVKLIVIEYNKNILEV